jgi:hypothetical protein
MRAGRGKPHARPGTILPESSTQPTSVALVKSSPGIDPRASTGHVFEVGNRVVVRCPATGVPEWIDGQPRSALRRPHPRPLSDTERGVPRGEIVRAACVISDGRG